jgi:hypothetical protein
VKVQFKNPGAAVSNVPLGKPNPLGVAADPAKIAETIAAGGDATLGADKYSAAGCAGCHNGSTAPGVDGTWTRVVNDRLKDAANANKTAEFYIVESILKPDAYHTPNFNPIMPTDFAIKLSEQDLKDIFAYLATKK